MHTNKLPLEQERIFSDFGCAEFNRTQDNPLALPTGFYEVQTSHGKKVPGFGFHCPVCKLHIPFRAPKEVRHCNKVTKCPEGLFPWLRFFFNLKTVRLQRKWY
jgi:hypothetical protein